jgi:hypothetical protein
MLQAPLSEGTSMLLRRQDDPEHGLVSDDARGYFAERQRPQLPSSPFSGLTVESGTGPVPIENTRMACFRGNLSATCRTDRRSRVSVLSKPMA